MALKDKNYHENKRKLNILRGGNGDYVVQIWSKDADGFNVVKNFEVCMSGGYAPHSVKMATFKLFEALEAEGLNEVEDE